MSQPRYEVEPGINNCLIIRDSHSSDLTSLTKHALTFLEQQSANSYVRRTLIVSDIDGNDFAIVCSTNDSRSILMIFPSRLDENSDCVDSLYLIEVI